MVNDAYYLSHLPLCCVRELFAIFDKLKNIFYLVRQDMSEENSTLKKLLFEKYDANWSTFNIRYLRLKIALFNKEIKLISSLVQITDEDNEDPFLNLLLSYLLSNFMILLARVA